MGHTYTSLLSHCIFSTKDRLPLIKPDIRDPLFAYLGGIVRSLHGSALIVGGVADHVHILASFPATLAMSDAMRLVKTNSSKWTNEEYRKLGGFAWQTGYGAFSVSRSNVDAVTAYIAD